MDKQWTPVVEAGDVTDEIAEMACSIVEGWYNDGPIDWENVWDRMDGTTLNDGSRLDMGGQFGTPAMKKIQRIVNKSRKES